MVGEIGAQIQALQADGLTVLLVEQNAAFARSLAEEVHILREGIVAVSRSAIDLDEAMLRALYLEG